MKVLIIVKDNDVLEFVTKALKDKSVIGLWGKECKDGKTTYEVVYK